MMHRAALVIWTIFLAGCHPPATPTPTVGRPGEFALTGTVREPDGSPVVGATVLLKGGTVRSSTVSAEDGSFRFAGVRGTFAVWSRKFGYEWEEQTVRVVEDQAVTLTLVPFERLVTGAVLRGVIDRRPCDPEAWDDTAPCKQILYAVPATGTLNLVVTWTGQSQIDLFFGGLNGSYWEPQDRTILVTEPVQQGSEYEIRLNAYWAPVPFAMTAEVRPR